MTDCLSRFGFEHYTPRRVEALLEELRGSAAHSVDCAARSEGSMPCDCGRQSLLALLEPGSIKPRLASIYADQSPARFFNCGNIALRLTEAEETARDIMGKYGYVGLVGDVLERLSRFFDPTDDTRTDFARPTKLELLHNMTASLQRVLLQLDRDFEPGVANLLTTDMEYPGCIAALDDVWSGSIAVAQIDEHILHHMASAGGRVSERTPPAEDEAQRGCGSRGGEDTPDKLRDERARDIAHEALVRAFNLVRPRVVFLSHVTRRLGFVLEERTVSYFRQLNPRVVIIVDGSQAIGNIVVKGTLLKEIDFYVAGGHKWLGGWTASGFVWTKDPAHWRREIADPAQTAHGRYPTATANERALLSLRGSLHDMAREMPGRWLNKIEEHNRDLAKQFAEGVRSSAIRIMTPSRGERPESGLVTIQAAEDDVGKLLEDALDGGDRAEDFDGNERREKAFEVTPLHDEGPMYAVEEKELARRATEERWRARGRERLLVTGLDGKGTPALKDLPSEIGAGVPRAQFRFCFHYYHSSEDVETLVEAINEAVKPKSAGGASAQNSNGAEQESG